MKKLLTTEPRDAPFGKERILMRNHKVCTHLHYSICKALGTEQTDKWYSHMPKSVGEEGDVTVLRNQAVHTD